MSINAEVSFRPLEDMWRRAERAREDSDVAYFYDLMILGEYVLKLMTLGVLSALVRGREDHRYRLEYQLVRADSIGVWQQVLDEALFGPPAQDLLNEAHDVHRDLTQKFNTRQSEWQVEATRGLHAACTLADAGVEPLAEKVSIRDWAKLFPALRNRVRGHGAPTGPRCSDVCSPLTESLRSLSEHALVFKHEWAHLHRNYSGKYRVSALGNSRDSFDYLTREKDHAFANGVYVWWDQPSRIQLIETEHGTGYLGVPNGAYRNGSFEVLSYQTDTTWRTDSDAFVLPPGAVPGSLTDAQPDMEMRGELFTDAPTPGPNYVTRRGIEEELLDVLHEEDRYPVITLHGSGGVGKTSMALSIIDQLSERGAYFAALWFSARDIDLSDTGPKLVQPQVLTIGDMATQLIDKLNPRRGGTKGFDEIEYLTETLSDTSETRMLFVLDNFETVRNPVDVFTWVSNTVRLPNKVLITTRYRDFKADYPVEVDGMNEDEFQELVERHARQLGIRALLTDTYLESLYTESNGHPYVAKVLLGEVAREGAAGKVKRVLASKDDILTALFERTYANLAPAAQRVFLTLCSWRSHVPRLALEAALLRSDNERMDIDEAVDLLLRSSLVESEFDPDRQEWLSVPLSSYLYGQRKLAASPMRIAIEADVEILQAFGASKSTDLLNGVQPAVRRLIAQYSDRLRSGGAQSLGEVLEFVAHRYPPAYLDLAELSAELGSGHSLQTPAQYAERYIEVSPNERKGWKLLAESSQRSGDALQEMNARLRMAEMPDVRLDDISSAANRFNSLLREDDLEVDGDEKRLMAQKLHGVLFDRISAADATDCSRMAWLSLHLGNQSKALAIARRGLKKEPTNVHCLNLVDRISTPT